MPSFRQRVGSPAAGRDLRLALVSAALAIVIFLPLALLCGLYLDDYSFLRMLEGATGPALWRHFIEYVPGRNLHIPFFYALIRLTDGFVPAMHVVSSAFDAVNAAMMFLLVRRLTGLRSVAWAAATMFVLAPNHGETHYWITLIPQCQIPTALTLGAFLLALSPSGPRSAAAIAVYAVALFTYDQVFFLWPLLLFVLWRADKTVPRRSVIPGAGVLLTLNVTHLALRYLSPYASGGRPLIRWSDFLQRCRDALVAMAKGIVPIPTPSYVHWGWSIAAAAGALAAGVWIVRRAAREAAEEGPQYASWIEDHEWVWIAAFGTAWTALAYAPNLFWYISPRHNLLPSIGWAIALAAMGAAAAARSPRLAALLPTACILAIVLAVLSNINEGTQWIASRQLREAFAAEVRHVAAPVDTMFLIGAPRYLHRAPAFNLPHDVALAAARELDRSTLTGGYSAAPTRTGVIYDNDLSILPANAFRWMPSAAVNLISYGGDPPVFRCAGSLSLQVPGGSRWESPLRPSRDCAATVGVPLEVALLESAAHRDSVPSRSAAGMRLLRAEVNMHEHSAALVLEWAVGAPVSRVLAIIPRIKDRNGDVLLDAVFFRGSGQRSRLQESFSRSRNPERPYPELWPLVDDVSFHGDVKPGQVLRQVFELRKTIVGGHRDGQLEVDLYQMEPDGTAIDSGHFSVPVVIKPSA